MKIASVADVKARLSAYLKESESGPVIVTRNGKAVAVLLAITDDDELERLILAHSPRFQAMLDQSRHRIEETGGIPHEQFWRDVETDTRQRSSKGKQGQRRTKRGT
jgi:prevent-host-death family protein